MTGLDATFRIFVENKERSRVAVVDRRLDSAQSDLRTRAVRALLARHSPAGHRELLHRWHQFDESQLQLVMENSDRMSGAIRDGVLSSDPELNRNACDAAVRLRDYDLIPTLVNAAEDTAHPHGSRPRRRSWPWRSTCPTNSPRRAITAIDVIRH